MAGYEEIGDYDVDGYDEVGYDEVGDYDIDGVDDDEVNGPRRRRRRRASSGRKQLPPGARNALQSGKPATLGKNLITTGQRREYLPFSATAALAATAASVAGLSVTCQKQFQPERLVLVVADVTTGADQSFSATLTQLEIGAENQFVASGEFPVSGFAPNAVNTAMLLDPLGPGVNATVQITRRAVTANAGVVSGGFIGACAQ